MLLTLVQMDMWYAGFGEVTWWCDSHCHHWSPQLESSQSSLLFCFRRSLPVDLEAGALLVVVPSAFTEILPLLVVEPAADLLCDDNLVPDGFSIDDLDDVCEQQKKTPFNIMQSNC